MKNLKFRSDPSLTFVGYRRPRRRWWLVPLLILGTGGLYAALQVNQETGPRPPYPDLDTAAVLVPLELPESPLPVDDALYPDFPAASHPTDSPAEQTELPNAGVTEPGPTAAEASADADVSDHWIVHEIERGDTLSGILKELDLNSTLLHRIVHCDKAAKQLAHIRPGQTLRIRVDAEERFSELMLEIDRTRTLRVSSNGDLLSAEMDELDTNLRHNRVSAVIESSLFESAQKVGLSDTMIMALADIFAWDIDFALEIRAGDRFSVVFSEEWSGEEKLRDGPILAAEFVNRGKIYRAVRFVDGEGKAGYYTPDGRQMRKDFLRTPVKFSRISSGFTKRRWHPVLKRWRSHRGVDYAAPTGTPVRAAGEGTISFVGRQGGYGQVIFISHQGNTSTVYGHLSRFAKGLSKGTRVKQGQLIGYVGQTGLASGPHLHYEFRIDGQHRNPLTVTQLPPRLIEKKYLPAFRKTTEELLAQLDSLNRTLVADAL